MSKTNLRDQKVRKVLHDHEDSSGPGVYLRAALFQIALTDPAKFSVENDAKSGGWYRCDRLPKMLGDAVSVSANNGYRGDLPWLPNAQKLQSTAFYVCPISIEFYEAKPHIVCLIFLRPADGTVFYINYKR